MLVSCDRGIMVACTYNTFAIVVTKETKRESLSKIVFSTLTLEMQFHAKAPMAIITLLTVLSQSLDETSIRQLSIIVTAVLTMSGRVTMLGIARWAEKGGSYRTIQRFYNRVIPWGM